MGLDPCPEKIRGSRWELNTGLLDHEARVFPLDHRYGFISLVFSKICFNVADTVTNEIAVLCFTDGK